MHIGGPIHIYIYIYIYIYRRFYMFIVDNICDRPRENQA